MEGTWLNHQNGKHWIVRVTLKGLLNGDGGGKAGKGEGRTGAGGGRRMEGGGAGGPRNSKEVGSRGRKGGEELT